MSRKNGGSSDHSDLNGRNVGGPDVIPNSAAIIQLRNEQGKTQKELAKRAGFSLATMIRMESMKKKNHVKAANLQAVALQFGVPSEMLQLSANGNPLALRSREWDPGDAQEFTPLRILSHGLTLRTAKLRSRSMRKGWGRLKIYDMPEFRNQRERARDVLSRHAEACRRIISPYVNRNHVCEFDSTGRYCVVVDEWIDSQPFDQVFEDSRPEALGLIAHELLLGLQAIHGANMICRGLSPSTAHWRISNHAVIADLELAKLLDETRTISPAAGLPRNRFIAFEVAEIGRDIGPAADLFSWAQTILWLAGDRGEAVVRRKGASRAWGLGLPPAVVRVLDDCSVIEWTKRPQTVASILEPIAKWAENEAREHR